MTKQILKNLLRTAIAPVIATGLIACTDTSDDFAKKGNFKEYEVYIWENSGERHISMQDKNQDVDFGPYLYAIDKDNDGRFDEIKLKRIPKGDSLEKYANLNSLEEIYKQISEQGE